MRLRQQVEEPGSVEFMAGAPQLSQGLANHADSGSEVVAVGVDHRDRLDHPDTRGCTPNGADPGLVGQVQLMCRATFVITELRPAE